MVLNSAAVFSGQVATKKIRIGVIGAGGMANAHHIPAALKHPQAEITSVCDVRPESAEATAKRYKIEHIYTDYVKMIEEAPIDAVVIVTSNDTHAPAAMAAINKGIHVLCEKPLTLNTIEAYEIALAAEKAGVINGVNFTYRQNPAVRYIKDILNSGDLGQVYQISLQYLQGGLADPDVKVSPGHVWRVQKRFAGHGVLGDLGSHLIDLSRYWMGEIVAVQSVQRTFIKERPTYDGGTVRVDGDDVTMALLHFQGGQIGTLQASWSAAPWGNHQRVEIYGSKGSIVYENENQRTIRAVFGGGPMFKYRTLAEIAVPEIYHAINKTHIEAFVDTILKDEKYSPNFNDGARCQYILDTIARVAEDGSRAEV